MNNLNGESDKFNGEPVFAKTTTGSIVVYLMEPDKTYGHHLFFELKKFGIAVKVFSEADKCLQAIRSAPPTALITAFSADRKEGHKLAKYYVAEGIDVPHIGYVGKALSDEKQKTLMGKIGLCRLLTIPFKIYDLMLAIREAAGLAGGECNKITTAAAPVRDLFAPPPTPAPIAERKEVRVPLKISVRITSYSDLTKLWSQNLSIGGIFIETPFPFEKGEDVMVELDLPVIGKSLSMKGRVVNVRRPDMLRPGETPGMGVNFIDHTHEQFETLSELTEMAIREPEKLVEQAPDSIIRTVMMISQSNIFDEIADELKTAKHIRVVNRSLAGDALAELTTNRPDIILVDISSTPDFPILVSEKSGALAQLPLLLVSSELELGVILDLLEKVDDVIELPSGRDILVDNLKAFFSLHQRTVPRIYCSYEAQINYGSQSSPGELRVISQTGCLIHTPADAVIESGAAINLKIDIPELEGPLILSAQIVNAIQKQESNRYGVKFLRSEPHEQQRLDDLVQEKLHTIRYLRWTYYPL